MPLWLRSRFKKDATPSSSDNVAADPIGSNAEAAREIVHVLRELNSEMKAMKTSICKEVAGLKKSFVYNARGYAEETDPAEDTETQLATFHPFRRLPSEIREKIWRMAVPGGRFFEPSQEYFRRYQVTAPHHWTGEWEDDDDADEVWLNHTITKLRKHYKNPVILAVCHESRQACQRMGDFEFGLFGSKRKGCWFNYTEDVVLVRTDMLSNVKALNLHKVQVLAFSDDLFITDRECIRIIDAVATLVPLCREVLLCYDIRPKGERNLGKPGRHRSDWYMLDDQDLVPQIGTLESQWTMSGQAVKWSSLRRTLQALWKKRLMHKEIRDRSVPDLFGLDMTAGALSKSNYPYW